MASDLGTPVTFSEWVAPFNGFIAACVEVSGQILAALVNGTQVTAGAVQQNAASLFGAGQADNRGATTFAAEQSVLARQGVATDLISVGGETAQQLAQTIQGFIGAGRPVGIGFNNATALQDTLSGQRFDAGVFGHAAVVEGTDATGALVADPNTAPGTGLVHYTWDNLVAGGADQLLVTQATARSFTPGSPTTLSANPPATFGGVPPFIPSIGGNIADAIGGAAQGFLNTLQADLKRFSLMALAAILLVFGLLVLFWEQAQAGGRAASNISGLADPPLKALQIAGAAKQARAKPQASVRETPKPPPAAPALPAPDVRGAYLQGAKDSPRVTGAEGGRRSGEARRAKKEAAAVEAAPAGEGMPESVKAARAKTYEGIDATMRELRGEGK